MSEAPEKIWLTRYHDDEAVTMEVASIATPSFTIPYIRADIAEAENKRLREALKRIGSHYERQELITHKEIAAIAKAALKGN